MVKLPTTKISIKTVIIAVAVTIIVAVATDADVIIALATINRDVTVTVTIIVAIIAIIVVEKTTATTSTTNNLGAVSSLEFGEEAFCAGSIQVRNLDESHSQAIPVIRGLHERTTLWTISIAAERLFIRL